MAIDCPHCHTRVGPKPDGSCPSCGEDTRDTLATDPTTARLVIEDGQRLPPVCADCGSTTDASVSITRTKMDEEGTALGQVLATLLLGWWAWLLPRRRLTGKVSVRLPLCDECRARGVLEPEHVDFEYMRMEFLVHRRLKEALAARHRP